MNLHCIFRQIIILPSSRPMAFSLLKNNVGWSRWVSGLLFPDGDSLEFQSSDQTTLGRIPIPGDQTSQIAPFTATPMGGSAEEPPVQFVNRTLRKSVSP